MYLTNFAGEVNFSESIGKNFIIISTSDKMKKVLQSIAWKEWNCMISYVHFDICCSANLFWVHKDTKWLQNTQLWPNRTQVDLFRPCCYDFSSWQQQQCLKQQLTATCWTFNHFDEPFRRIPFTDNVHNRRLWKLQKNMTPSLMVVFSWHNVA